MKEPEIFCVAFLKHILILYFKKKLASKFILEQVLDSLRIKLGKNITEAV